MSEAWTYLKKSLPCKSQSSEVHDPKANKHQRKKQGKKNDCSDIKDVIHESMSRSGKQQPTSPKSNASTAMLLNPVTHEIVLDSTNGEIKICPCFGKGDEVPPPRRSMKKNSTARCVDCDECNMFSNKKVAVQKDSNDHPRSTCDRDCRKHKKSLDPVEEEHDVSEHFVIHLRREDSAWQVIEKICEADDIDSEKKAAQIECILKLQNTPKTFAHFEECREKVMVNVERLQNKHPRCLVDGNELLRFHGTTIACSLGVSGSSSLCTLDQCGVCHILRHGFSANQEVHGEVGVITTSTCEKAIDSSGSSNGPVMRKAVIVCRVIAGRINNPLQEIQEMMDSGYDSVVKKVSGQSDIEELSVLNPRAVLPCFVVIYKF